MQQIRAQKHVWLQEKKLLAELPDVLEVRAFCKAELLFLSVLWLKLQNSHFGCENQFEPVHRNTSWSTYLGIIKCWLGYIGKNNKRFSADREQISEYPPVNSIGVFSRVLYFLQMKPVDECRYVCKFSPRNRKRPCCWSFLSTLYSLRI